MALSDMAYGVITVLQSKLEGLEVYDIYIEHCEQAGDEHCRQLFEPIRHDDERHAQTLRDYREQPVQQSTLRRAA